MGRVGFDLVKDMEREIGEFDGSRKQGGRLDPGVLGSGAGTVKPKLRAEHLSEEIEHQPVHSEFVRWRQSNYWKITTVGKAVGLPLVQSVDC